MWFAFLSLLRHRVLAAGARRLEACPSALDSLGARRLVACPSLLCPSFTMLLGTPRSDGLLQPAQKEPYSNLYTRNAISSKFTRDVSCWNAIKARRGVMQPASSCSTRSRDMRHGRCIDAHYHPAVSAFDCIASGSYTVRVRYPVIVKIWSSLDTRRMSVGVQYCISVCLHNIDSDESSDSDRE